MDTVFSTVDQARTFVQDYLLAHLPPGFLYHNFNHVEEVVDVCEDIAAKAELSTEASETLVLAAWFHDIGYAHPEEKVVAEGSVEIARDFLNNQGVSGEKQDQIFALIRSIHKSDPPEDILEKILHDANYAYLGRKRFFRRSKLLWLEEEKVNGKKFTNHTWNQLMLEKLVTHKFYTPWAQEQFSGRLSRNIVQQKKNIHNAYKLTTRKKTGKDFGRGVDTLYRITLRNHVNLSRIADGKANMIISINTLVLSILITAGAAGYSLDRTTIAANIQYVAPVLMLMLTSLAAIIFAVLSATPKLLVNHVDKEAIRQHKVSLLFFGNFLQLEKQEFVEHLRELKKDQELLYDDLSKDLYNLGAVLKKKYRLLSISYRIFLGGLVISFLIFLSLYFL